MRVERKRKINDLIRKALLVFCFVLGAGVLSPLAAAASEGEAETVRVGYYENEVFQEGAREGAAKTGYAYEYYRKLSEYTGWKYEYVYGGFNELYGMLEEGEIDLLAGLAWRSEREEVISYPDAIMGSEAYYLVKNDQETEITVDPATLNGRRIGVLDSVMVGVLNTYLQEHHVAAQVITFQDQVDLLNAFDSHAADVIVAEGDGAHAREHAQVLYAFASSDYYLCVNKKRPDLLKELNQAQMMLAAEEPNYLNSLRMKYYPMSFTTRAFSEAEREWLRTHDSLHVGYFDNYLPFSDTDDQGQVNGMILDILPQMMHALGIPGIGITYTGYESYDAMIQAMSDGMIDVAFPVGGGLYYSEENGIYQSSPVSSADTVIVYRDEYTENTAKRFAVNENNRMQYYFVKTKYPNAEISFYPSIADCLAAVDAGMVTCTTLNGMRANDILRNSQYKNLSMRQSGTADERCFGVEIGNEGLLKLLNRGINVLGSDSLQNLAFRYAGSLYHYSVMDFLREHFVMLGSLILLVILLIMYLLMREARRKSQEAKEKEAARKVLEEKNRELADSQQALSGALINAEHANRAKTVFLNNMSHDIRTPMNAIVGFTALAQSHIDNKEQVQDYLSRISVSSQHLLSLINDVLDMSRIESGKVTLEEAETNLPELIRELETIIQSSVSAKSLTLKITAEHVVHEDIITDRLRLNQVLLNLLSNAIKFTPSGGAIWFRIIEKPCDLAGSAAFEFRVKDNGIGMSEEFQKTIFEAFTREKSSTVSGIQGTGLGMAITKNIVDMMGGTIAVDSKEGIGSEFAVNLCCRIPEGSGVIEPIPSLNGARALVMCKEDALESVASLFEALGIRKDETEYAADAVRLAEEAIKAKDPYAVFVIDRSLPEAGGIETTGKLRALCGREGSIIVLAESDESAHETDGAITAFLAKPVFRLDLWDVLAKTSGKDSEAENKESESPDFSGFRVLIAEDNEMNQMIAAAILAEAGFMTEIASDGAEAVEMMENHPAGFYDIVLMDVQMPRMDGYEAARRIRALADPAKASIPIVAVTANAFEEDRKNSLESGMNGHLAKPYDVAEIMRTLREILLKREKEKE